MHQIEKTDEQWQSELDEDQYAVLRCSATEAPFSGKYVYEKANGMYCCAACGNELFSSETKYDSGSGWPSFTEPAIAAAIETREDVSHGMVRTEVVCARCGGHLGHVFDDGPADQGGMRYCINSLALDLDTSEA